MRCHEQGRFGYDSFEIRHTNVAADNEAELRRLAQRRAKSVRDYLAARDAPPAHIELAEPVIDRDPDARPRATLSITGK